MITVVCIWAGHDGNIYKCKNGHEIVRLSWYEAVPYAFKINYHTDSWEIVSSGCKCRTYSKYRAVKPRNFIGLELVVNEIMIYEWSFLSVDKNWSKIELSWFLPRQFHLNLLGSLKSNFWKNFQIWACSRHDTEPLIRRNQYPNYWHIGTALKCSMRGTQLHNYWLKR